MRSRSALTLIRLLGLLAAVSLALFAAFGPSVVANDTPGNNSTVKIHDGPGENNNGEVRNEPHVCTFHLHFYFADPEQTGTWEIQEWAPTGQKGTVVLSGTYDTHGDGEDRQPEQGVYSLPNGHYKLFWDGDLDTGKHDKMKVFWVDCAPQQTPTPTGSELPANGSPTPTGSELPANGSPTPTGSELAVNGTPPPTGGVAGLVGTPHAATPPATDTATVQRASDNSWRTAVLGLAAFIAATALLIPSQRPLGTRTIRPRRDGRRDR